MVLNKLQRIGLLSLSVWSILTMHSAVVWAQSEVGLEEYMLREPSQSGLNRGSTVSDPQAAYQNRAAAQRAATQSNQARSGESLPNVAQDYNSQEDFDSLPELEIDPDSLAEQFGVRQKTAEELAEEIRQESFDAALTGLFPLQTDHIRELISRYDETQRAVEEPIHGYPVPEVRVQTVSLDPGVMPMTIKTAVGHVTTLNMLDVTGAPWPVQDISWAGDFEVTEPEEGGHVIRITPMAVAAYGNISIRLLTLKTPITIALRTDKDRVQYRVDARIPEFGPYASTPIIQGGTTLVAGNKLINDVLDGTPPGSAQRLAVSGVDGRTTAYLINGMTYVRTPLTLLSPGWESSVSSADGMNVYALNRTPVLLLSDEGQFKRASLKVQEDIFDE